MSTNALALALSLFFVVAAPIAAVAQGTGAPIAVPAETDGQIDGKPARYLASGDNVLLTTAEADRLGIDYRRGKSLAVGNVTLWVVTLGSVTVDGTARLFAQAGVVADVAAYLAALQAHAVEAFALSHRVEVQIDGQAVQAFDFGAGGLLVPLGEADRIGLAYRDGKRDDVGSVPAWRLEKSISRAGQVVPASLVVAEPQAYLKALQARPSKDKP